MKPPANRYRIEERGRRLVTIDTWAVSAEESPTSAHRGRKVAQSKGGRFGHVRFVSAYWYDLRAPRVIDISLWSVALKLAFNRLVLLALLALVIFAVLLAHIWLPVLVVALLIPASRSWLAQSTRRFITRRIDKLAVVE